MIILDLSWFVWKHDSSLHPMVDHWLITIFLPVHTSSSLKSSASCGSSTFNMIRISLISLWCGVYIYILILLISEWFFGCYFCFTSFIHVESRSALISRKHRPDFSQLFFRLANWVYLQNLVFGMEKKSGSPVEYTYLDFLLPPNKQRIVENDTIDHTHMVLWIRIFGPTEFEKSCMLYH